MESTGSNAEYRSQQRFAISDTCSRPGPSSSVSGNQWQSSVKETRRENVKLVDRTRNRSLHGKNRENFNEEDNKNWIREERKPPLQPQQITPGFPAYTYNTSEQYVDHNQRAIPVMPAYNYMNHQWGVNPLDGMSVSQNNLSVTPAATSMSMMPAMDMGPNSGTGLTQYGLMGVTPENSMLAMMGVGSYCPYGMINGQDNFAMHYPKPLIRLSKCVLMPSTRPSSKKEKPPLCKTVYVGNLLEKITKEIIEEIFEQCGKILSVNMNGLDGYFFCHIRFDTEEQVQAALYFDGYKIKLDDETCSKPIVVNYANNEDDQHEYEYQIHAMKREARHRERQEKELYRTPIPPPVVPYCDHEVAALVEKLKCKETFQLGIFVLKTWLDRGECNKQNSHYFYSMIQSALSNANRFIGDKQKFEDEFNKAKNILKQQMQGMLLQFHEIEKIFHAASIQKVWDHFTKPQRKSINLWKTQTQQYKSTHIQEMVQDREEDEMEVCNDDSPEKSQDGSDNEAEESIKKKIANQREKNNKLRSHLEVAKNEISEMMSESAAYESEIEKLEMEKKLKEGDIKFNQRYISNLDNDSRDSQNVISEMECMQDSLSTAVSSSSGFSEITETEAHLVGLISTFLNVHPLGASLDYICSYLHQIDNTFKARDVENLLKKFPLLFKEQSRGIGASLEKKWFYFGFKSPF